MRICIIAEGCYPYVVGGMSSWAHGLIRSFPHQEFVILTIVANRELRGKFVYELPENVVELHELYLDDLDWCRQRKRKSRMNKREYQALRSLMLGDRIEWEELIDFFQIYGLFMDNAFHLSAAVSGIADEDPEGGRLSLSLYRICGGTRLYGKAYPRRTPYDIGTWYLYQGAGRRTDPVQMGEGHLQKYLDRAVS